MPPSRRLRVRNAKIISISNEKPPRLPQPGGFGHECLNDISISNEKPLRLPPGVNNRSPGRRVGFNLKREAAPVATNEPSPEHYQNKAFQSQTRSRSGCHRLKGRGERTAHHRFNLKREAAPVATKVCQRIASIKEKFQSQTRSRSGCHSPLIFCMDFVIVVSISNEKPPRLPRHLDVHPSLSRCYCFNLKREAAPVATGIGQQDLAPNIWVSISNEKPPRLPHGGCGSLHSQQHVSISNEKPPRLPRHVAIVRRQERARFNLKREAAPVATPATTSRRIESSMFQSQTRSRPGCHA